MYIQCKIQSLEPVGMHCHIGSQLTQLEPIKESVKIVADLVRNLKAIKIELSFYGYWWWFRNCLWWWNINWYKKSMLNLF